MPAIELLSCFGKFSRTRRANLPVLIGVAAVGLLGTGACRREIIEPRPGLLRFSRDTIYFDSLFSTVLSPTQRLWVYNPHPYPVHIRAVRLERGEASPFSFVFDGQAGPIGVRYTIGSRDSLQVFLQVRDTTQKNTIQEDKLLIDTDAGRQEVLLRVALIAAYVYRDFGFDSVIVSFPTDKPVIIDGYFYVGPSATLRILPGTRLYFSGRRWESGPLQGELASGLYIAGRLEAMGTPQSPIFMQGWRLEPYYSSAPGQWQGIWFFPSSSQNRLLYTHISQSSIAVRIDSAGGGSTPKVVMEGCLIRDAANYGILTQGFAPILPAQPILQAVNTLVYRCGQACAAFLGGGTYRLVHCAFIYDQGDLRRGVTSLAVSDYLEVQNQTRTYPIDFWALNSLFWTTKEDAVSADLRGGTPVQWLFDHCAFRQKDPLPGVGNLSLTSPGVGSASDDYPLLENSPLIDRGRYDAGLSPQRDLVGRRRDAFPDIGAYEYVR